jgi:rhodanese-related sulfurtransferase
MNHQQRSHRVRRAAALVAVGTIGLAACGGENEPQVAVAAPVGDTATAGEAATAPAFGLVSPQAALALSDDDDVTVIDVRTAEEYESGHIDGATMIDFYADSFADEIGALDPDGTYLLYCRSGNRSGQTASLMQQLGFEQVYDMDGGVVAFGAQGLPLVP